MPNMAARVAQWLKNNLARVVILLINKSISNNNILNDVYVNKTIL